MLKTGTSSIQKWMRTNYDALEAMGVHSNEGAFRKINRRGRRELSYLIFQVARDEFYTDETTAWLHPWKRNPALGGIFCERCKFVTTQLAKLSGKPGIFIYSYEDLYKCNEVQIAALDKYFSRFFDDITYVVYIRNTVDFLVSYYSEKLRTNFYNERIPNRLAYRDATLAYDEYLENCMKNLVPYGTESSLENLVIWDKMLGDRLNVRLLETDWLVNGDLLEDFASLVGVVPFNNINRINESFGADYIEYVRFLNREFHAKLPRNIRRKALEILTVISSGKQKIAVSDAQARLIRDIRLEQEEKIRKKFFRNRPHLFSPKFRSSGIAPTPLTWCRKVEIESEIRKNGIVDWEPYDLVRGGQ